MSSDFLFSRWLMYFFIYCFLGWCWESVYVSVKEKKWVNRGFMKGPYIPIYGCGAIFILIATLSVEAYPVAVYFCGMIAATALEYVTGVAMEAIFKVRYWDYSNEKFNVNGHICLKSSIAWGFMSLLMVYIIHEPIAAFVSALPKGLLNLSSLVLAVFFGMDFGYSFKTAFDLRAVILNNERIMKELLIAQIRLEMLEANMQDREREAAEKFADIQSIAAKRFAEYKKNGTFNVDFAVGKLKDKVEHLGGVVPNLVESAKSEKLKNEIAETRMKIRLVTEKRRTQLTGSIQSLIRRNPSAISDKYAGILEELRNNVVQLSTPRWIADKLKKFFGKRG